MILQSVAVTTVPSSDMARGSVVGTVTFSLVGVISPSSPPPMPPFVVVRLTGVVPEPPEMSISAALAQTASDSIMQSARQREMSLLQFRFIAIIQKLLSKIQ